MAVEGGGGEGGLGPWEGGGRGEGGGLGLWIDRSHLDCARVQATYFHSKQSSSSLPN